MNAINSANAATTINISHFIAGTMILRHGIGHKYIRTDLGPPADFFLIPFNIVDIVQMSPLFNFNELGREHLHTHFPVLMLTAFVLAGNHNPGRDVGQPHR